MVATAAPEKPVIDRSACPATRGHGTTHYGRLGCVCPDAVDDARRHKRRLRFGDPTPPLDVDPIGTARRLQAAAVAGHDLVTIAGRLGTSTQVICQLRKGSRTRIHRDRADRIRRVVDELLAGPDPVGYAATRTRALAARCGWVPLCEWLPEEVDDPAALPDSAYRVLPPDGHDGYEPTPLELREMVDLDWSLAAIIERTKLPEHVVVERLKNVGEMERRGRRAVPAETIYAIRDEYLRTRHAGWQGKAVAARYGVSTWLVSTVIHGTTRPELGLTDLTVQQGGHTPAAPPTGRENRKGTAA